MPDMQHAPLNAGCIEDLFLTNNRVVYDITIYRTEQRRRKTMILQTSDIYMGAC